MSNIRIIADIAEDVGAGSDLEVPLGETEDLLFDA